MIEIEYLTIKNPFNQIKKFPTQYAFYSWVKKMEGNLMDYTIIKKHRDLKLDLHFRKCSNK
jgi:hypothetical protein